MHLQKKPSFAHKLLYKKEQLHYSDVDEVPEEEGSEIEESYCSEDDNSAKAEGHCSSYSSG